MISNRQLLRRRHAFSLIELMVLTATVLLGVSLALPALQRAREDARMVQCRNNLHQLGLAMHNYHDVYSTFPPGWVQHHWEADSPAGYGWGTSILPYIDQAPLFNQIDFGKPPSTDQPHLLTVIAAYRCPADTMDDANPVRGGLATSNYSGNFGRTAPPRWLPSQMSEFWPGQADTPNEANGIFWCNSFLPIRQITDGSSNTFLLGERCVTSGAGIWPGVTSNRNENDHVTDCSHPSRLNDSYASFSSRHDGGANFLMCDGRVVFLSDDIDSRPGPAEGAEISMYQRLADRHDGQPVEF